jgi:hypothetical protein
VSQELLTGEVNLVHLISKREGCSHNRAAEIVNGMVVDRCKDMSLTAAELRQGAESTETSSFPDRNTSSSAPTSSVQAMNFINVALAFINVN